MSQRRSAWTWFVATAVVLLASLVWLTTALVGLDRDEANSRRLAAAEQKLRLGLWRMDSWLSPRLAREAMRPASEYRAFAPAETAWTRGFSRIGPDEVVVPSPLLTFESELFALHFELQSDGTVTSPQVPTGNERDVAEAEGRDGASFERAAARLHGIGPRLAFAGLADDLRTAEQLLPLGCNLMPNDKGPVLQQRVVDYGNRQVANALNQGNIRAGEQNESAWLQGTNETIGPMVPIWLAGDEPELVFARRVVRGGATRLQGVVIDWATLERELLALVSDLFDPGCAELARCIAPTSEEHGSMLASVPARLVARPRYAEVAGSLFTSRMLWISWAAVLMAITALGFTLREALGFGERRARFASAVTHELRTPLTTFRMYSEMLADDIVTDPATRREYLQTLRLESDRLARVVENVLAWSRLEQGRFAGRRERHAVGELIARLEPPCARRLADVGLQLEVRVEESAVGAECTTDEDAVGQILFNLVDNAAKYASSADDKVVTLAVSATATTVAIDLLDRGPGVPAAHRRRIFAAFDRGAVPTASNEQPGVGLGLALSRGLARDLGGDLRFVETASGACFRIELPRG